MAVQTANRIAFKPIGDRIVVKVEAAEERTPSGLLVPESAREKPRQGEVMAVGTGRIDEHGKRLPMEMKNGDKVVFEHDAGSPIILNGEEFSVLSERDVLGIMLG